LLSIDDYHQVAKKKLPKMVYDYYRSGADDEITLNENENAYRRIKLKPSVFVDVSIHETDENSCKTHVLHGKSEISFPVIIAPTAMQRMATDLGEKATARAAVRANTIMILSTLATTKLEDVAIEHKKALTEHPGSISQLWYQLYILKDREFTKNLVQRAEQSGYKAIVVTVDAPRLGNREADRRNTFRLPENMQMENLLDPLKEVKNTDTKVSALNDYFVRQVDASLTWKDITWLRSITKLPIIVKGIIKKEDALLAIRANVDGIVVSNHGARQLDTTISTIESLPEIVQAVRSIDKNIEIYIDGGIRRGTDVLKALAFGANAVFVGRPIIWGLTVNGEEGVLNVLNILKKEFKLAMMLCGCPTLDDVNESILAINNKHTISKL
ncbi:unnamed protein product, partial [Didymodactylos carnosus]